MWSESGMCSEKMNDTWNRLCRTKFYRYVSCNCMCISVIFITEATRHRILNLKHGDCSMHCIRQKSTGWLSPQNSSGCSKIRVSFTNKHHSKGPNMPPAVVFLSRGNFGFATLSNRRVIRRIFWCEPQKLLSYPIRISWYKSTYGKILFYTTDSMCYDVRVGWYVVYDTYLPVCSLFPRGK